MANPGTPNDGEWYVVDSERFSEKDAQEFKSATVVDTDFGLSMLFLMRNGSQHNVLLDNRSKLTCGEACNVIDLEIVTYRNGGHGGVIYRCKEIDEASSSQKSERINRSV